MAGNPERTPRLHVAFNSLSAASARPDHVLFARHGTPELARRVVALEQRLAETFDGVSVSVLPGRNIAIPDLAAHLAANNVRVSSVDIPDVQSIPKGLWSAVTSTLRGDIPLAKGHVGWTASNVGSENQQLQRTTDALHAFTTTDTPMQIVKANAAFWIDNQRQGAALDALLQREQRQTGTKLGLAIEISADHQTHGDYFAFLERKRAEHEGKIGIYADMDLGHLERSRSVHPDAVMEPAIGALEKVLDDPKLARTVKIISLNQYVSGETQTHSSPDQGGIALDKATHLMGQAMARGKLFTDTVALFETHPADYQWFFSREGILYCGRLADAFRHGALYATNS